MKRWMMVLILIGLSLGLLSALLQPSAAVQALPEYSAQVGEPCASCHISPSGGGPRTPRGMAWVGDGKPGVVPGLLDALEKLGVRLEIDPQDFVRSAEEIPAAAPLLRQPGLPAGQLQDHLQNYEGN